MQQFFLLLASHIRMVHLLILMNQCWYIINLSLHFIQISSLFYYCCFSVSQSHSGYRKTFKCWLIPQNLLHLRSFFYVIHENSASIASDWFKRGL